jgi:O-antigen/teichoic acid export membrane protein
MQRLMGLPLLGQAGLYVAINGLASLFPLLVVPVITRTVTPQDYGIYAIFLVGVNLLMPLVGLGFETASGRRYVDRKEMDYPAYIATGLGLTVGLSALVYAALIALAPTLASFLPVPGTWFWSWVFVAWAQTIVGLILVLNQMADRPVLFGVWRIGRALVLNGLFLVFILSGQAGWTNLVTVLIITHGGVALCGLIWLWRSQLVALRTAYTHLSHIVRYGTPLVPHMIGAALVTATDRILLVNLIDEAAAGIYTIGYQVGLVMFLMSQSVNRAWTPWFYARLKDGSNDALQLAMKTGYTVAGIYVLAGIGFSVVGWFALPWIFGETYVAATPVFVWIVAAFVAQGLWSLTASYLYYSEATVWVSASSAGAALFNVGLTYVLIQTNGLVGAAQATFVAYALGFATIAMVTVRRAPLPWRLGTH